MKIIKNTKKQFFKNLRLTAAFLIALLSNIAQADAVNAAVAANFTAAIKQLAPLFEKKTGHKLLASFGATGQLYTQINNGAPFDVFLSADAATPQKLIDAGVGVAGTQFIYARGQLALWSSRAGYIDANGAILKTGAFNKIALANPKTAPYGQTAIDTLNALHLLDELQPRFVMGENIAQTQQFISSGNVPLGFIALAQVKALPLDSRGSYWVVPANLYPPLDQSAVLLSRANQNAAAKAFLTFLKSPEATAIISELGYEVSR